MNNYIDHDDPISANINYLSNAKPGTSKTWALAGMYARLDAELSKDPEYLRQKQKSSDINYQIVQHSIEKLNLYYRTEKTRRRATGVKNIIRT